MSADLITEEQARQLSGADTLVLAEQRGIFDYIFWLIFVVLMYVGLTYPFWREFLPERPDFPAGFAIFGGLFSWMFARFMGNDLKAVRQPSSWVLRMGSNVLLLKFRSYHHWMWPREDKVVLRLSPLDIDFIQPIEATIRIRTGKNTEHKTIRQIEFHLYDALLPEICDAIRREHARMVGKGFVRSRSGHKPVQVSADGRIVRLEFERLAPGFQNTLQILGGRCRVRPVAALETASSMDDRPPALTSAVLRQVSMLAAGGDKIEAIRLLRQHTGLSLKEAKDAVEQGVEARLGHLVDKTL